MNPLFDLIVIGFVGVMVLLNIYFYRIQSITSMTIVHGFRERRPVSHLVEQGTLIRPPSAVHLPHE
jgi:hypothetical protein